MNDDSILTSIKKLLGIDEGCGHFDTDIIIHINSVFSILAQIGVGPADGFSIGDGTVLWSDYLPDDALLNDVRTYVFLKVRMVFDPPLSNAVIEANRRMVDELEWRLNVAVEKG